MSFINSTPQKRGILAAQQGTRINASTRLPHDVVFRKEVGPTRAKRRRMATIGDRDAAGLTILGTTTRIDDGDPYGADVSGDNPNFNVAYSGLGRLRFSTPVAFNGIQDDLHVQGDVYANGTLLTGGVSALTATPWTTFSPLIELGGTALSTQTTMTGIYKSIDDAIFFDLLVAWTGGLGGGTGAITITLPTAPVPETDTGGYEMKTEQGLFTTNLGNDLQVYHVGGELEIYESDVAAGGTNTALTHANMLSTGQLRIWGHYQEA